jgi:hypothetical protein
VPTPKGIRLFVDALLKVQPLSDAEIRRLQAEMDALRSGDGDILGSASTLLSALTRMAGVVTVPRRGHSSLRQIEFLPLSDNRILAILVIDEKEVQNRILHMERSYTADELREASNYLNAQFAGKSLARVREKLLTELADTRETMNSMMVGAISMARQAFETADDPGQGFVLAGETNLMQFAELSNVERLRGPVRGLREAARHPAPAGPVPGRGEPADLHRRGIGLPHPRVGERRRQPVLGRRRGRRRARRDRPDAHGLRPDHPDRGHHRPPAGLGLEFERLGPRSGAGRDRKHS